MAAETRTGSPADASLDTILVPVDFSEHSIQAVDYAIRLAGVFGSRVVLVHVYHFPVELLTDWSSYGTLAGSAEILEGLRKDREEQMAALVREKSRAGVPLESRVVEGTPFSEICKVARAEGANLIVMGTRGLTGLKHVLIGSTAEKVVRKAPCPVLTVKHPKLALEMP